MFKKLINTLDSITAYHKKQFILEVNKKKETRYM